MMHWVGGNMQVRAGAARDRQQDATLMQHTPSRQRSRPRTNNLVSASIRVLTELGAQQRGGWCLKRRSGRRAEGQRMDRDVVLS